MRSLSKAKYKNHFAGFMLTILALVLFDWSSVSSESGDSTISKFIRLGLLVYMSVFILNFNLKERLRGFYFKKPIILMLFVVALYTILSDNVIKNSYANSKMVLWVLASFYFFILFKKGAIKTKQFKFFVFLLLFIMSILNIYAKIITDEFTGINGYSYPIVWCFPLIFMFKRNLKWYLVFGVSILSIFFSIKRGAIISIVLSTIVYYLSMMYLTKRAKDIKNFVFGILALFIVGYFAFLKNMDFYLRRFEDTSGSGRDKLYVKIFNAWSSSDLKNILFGFGSNQTQVLTKSFSRTSKGIYAHSDWFQFLYDFGILGVFLILFFHIYILKLIMIGFKNKNFFTPILAMTYVILFLVNIFSGQLLFANYMMFLSIIIAFSSYTIYNTKTTVNGFRVK